MSFAPRPSPAVCQTRASSAAGLRRGLAPARHLVHRRGAREQRRARRSPGAPPGAGPPRSSPRCGRPPSPTSGSARGSPARVPAGRAALPSCVIATACGPKSSPLASGRPRPPRACRCASRACRPTSRSRRRASRRARRRARRARGRCRRGRCCRGSSAARRSRRPPRASATSCGPSAEPPMPITSTRRKRSAAWRPHAAVVDARREVQDARLRLADGRRRSRAWARAPARAASSGRPSASRRGWRVRPARAPPSPRAPLDERGLALREGAVVETHSAQVEPEPERRLVEQQRLVASPRASVGSWRSSSAGAILSRPASARPAASLPAPAEAPHWQQEAVT